MTSVGTKIGNALGRPNCCRLYTMVNGGEKHPYYVGSGEFAFMQMAEEFIKCE